ncbi:ornithine cyclodeaminase family protein [Archangium violaceum]|uniref:ornithine cyclodeaminase family protein n=1 Tax=Archangium violaceum TaxID=83451 RepID=UPI00193BFD42|nr:ornithine cyclodeaminase family protein [Archangium violaceum]QRK08319.1 ornithine cyclodeaminase family protein [Archangium violaceum]
MDTLLITQQDLKQIVARVGIHALMDGLLHSLERALQEFDETQTEVRKREGFLLEAPQPGVLEWMPVMRKGDSVTLKIVSYAPANPRRFGIPTIIANNSLYDVQTGHLRALVDGVLATALRTGAASAIASKYLAHPDSRVVGLVGCGAQAVTQLHALSRVFGIERVLAYDIDPDVQKSLPARVAFLGLEVLPAPLEVVEAQADILCTATSVEVGAGPVIRGTALKPHVHINAVGSDLPGKIELPLAVLERSLVCPDFLAQALVEGECQQLSPEKIGPHLVELAKEPARFQAWRQRGTVFDSTGFALEDQVVTEVLLQHALALGLGTVVQLENINGSALDPYGYVFPRPGLEVAA